VQAEQANRNRAHAASLRDIGFAHLVWDLGRSHRFVQGRRSAGAGAGAAESIPGLCLTGWAADGGGKAAHPSRLTAEMAGASFGSSVHFQTDLGALDIDEGSLSPLPFPPAEVWCVLLKGDGAPTGQVALVARYLDLYAGDWIVHQGPDDVSSVKAQHLLSTLGCTLTPKPGDFDALDRVKQNGHGSDASARIPTTLD
jgi:hypothetical protein